MERERGKPSNENWIVTMHIFEVVGGHDNDLTEQGEHFWRCS